MFSSPGTRISKHESEKNEISAFLRQASIIALAGDAIIAVLLLILLLLGRLVILPLSAVLTIAALRLFFYVFAIEFPVYTGRFIVTKDAVERVFATVAIIVVVFNMPELCNAIGFDALYTSIIDLLNALVPPTWLLSIVAIVWFVAMLVDRKDAGAFLSAVFYAAWLLSAFSGGVLSGPVIATLKGVCITLFIPWLVSFSILAIVTVKNIIFPYLDYNLKPFTFEELRAVGWRGLLWPGEGDVIDGDIVQQDVRNVRVELVSGKSTKFLDIPDTAASRQFYAMLACGASFTLRNAKSCGLTRNEFEKLRDIFVDGGFAEWKSAKDRRQGVVLTENGLAAVKCVVEG